jgi:DNA-binding transcriptional LysR family regulator
MPHGEWSDYRYFLAVARRGSLSGAARDLGVDQSTVGRRLAALEAAVAARLFDRTPDGWVLTPAGEGVRAEVERLEEGFLAVERRLSGGDARIAGVVRVATPEAFASAFLIPHLAALKRRHPELSIDLVSGIQPVDLARREADLAVRLGAPPKQPYLIVRPAGAVRFALYAAPGYLARRQGARTRAGLRGHAVVAFGGDLALTPISRWLEARAKDATVAFRANTIAAVYDAVSAGLGIGALPCVLGDRGLTRLRAADEATAPIWTVVHEDLARSARVRAVLAFVSEVVGPPR